MSKNKLSHFESVPTAKVRRSSWKDPHTYTTTLDEGDLIPIKVKEVYPGDTISIPTSALCRMATPIFPVMGDAYLDLYYFYVPSRLLWSHWKELMGENNTTAWAQTQSYVVPSYDLDPDTEHAGIDAEVFGEGSLGDYFGIPTKVTNLSINALPFRAYRKIYNEWFRSENLQDPVLEYTSDTVTGGEITAMLGNPLKVGKYRDYFTSCLPAPQKGSAVDVPLQGLAPVHGVLKEWTDAQLGIIPPMFKPQAGNLTAENYYTPYLIAGGGENPRGTLQIASGSSGGFESQPLMPTNLAADFTGGNASFTVNKLREAFAIQRMLERDARSGSRYIELIESHFGVSNPDYRLQRSEYLGGAHIQLNMAQVVQQSQTATTPQGNVSGLSKTPYSFRGFTKSFTEHGYVIGLACVRVRHAYQQGLNKLWSRRTRYDFYDPIFANLGEMPVLNKEIYADGSSADNEVFGYQEAWADLRYTPSLVTGEMRSNATAPLDAWHYADNYAELPYLSGEWIEEDDSAVDRTIAVPSSPQFILDLFFDERDIRPMPLYSVPGLIDHH